MDGSQESRLVIVGYPCLANVLYDLGQGTWTHPYSGPLQTSDAGVWVGAPLSAGSPPWTLPCLPKVPTLRYLPTYPLPRFFEREPLAAPLRR